jgi:hypothetical protein
MIPRRSHRKRKSTGLLLDYLSDEDGDLNEASKKQKLHQEAFEEVRGDLQKILTSLMRHQFGAPFNQPVDPVALNIPDYFEKITNPMDFSTIQKKKWTPLNTQMLTTLLKTFVLFLPIALHTILLLLRYVTWLVHFLVCLKRNSSK